MQEIEFFLWWLFQLPARYHSQSSSCSSTFLPCLGFSSKSHRGSWIWLHSFATSSSSSIAMKSFFKCQTFFGIQPLYKHTVLCYYSATLDIVSKLFRISCFSCLSLLLKMYKCSFERLLMCVCVCVRVAWYVPMPCPSSHTT